MKTSNMIDVSIVIVCMNNLKNLYPCLNSIRKYTSVSYETLVVAYLFSKENLEKVKQDFPWVTFIESNDIRGFSENNNLALRQAKGKYCFVLNDDTYMDMPVIDRLVETIQKLPDDVACVSPKSYFPDGTFQSCGRPAHTYFATLLSMFNCYNWRDVKSKYVNQKGIFETTTVTGAFFLIKTEIFKAIGFFNEDYFFCPEDVEVGIKLKEIGYKCFVDSDVYIYHIDGGTYKVSKIRTATMPAAEQGNLILYGDTIIKRWILIISMKVTHYLKYVYWRFKIKDKWDKAYIMAISHKNTFDSVGKKLTTKDIFKKYYSAIKQ